MGLRVVPHVIDGAFLIECDRFHDNRGFFQELYKKTTYPESMVQEWGQINISMSNKNVVRGMHTSPYPKLVCVMRGRLIDIVVDLREGSPTYLKQSVTELSADVPRQSYIPAGCAHGFYTCEDDTAILYMQGVFDPAREMDVNWRDATLAIAWPASDAYVLSDKDRNAPDLATSRRNLAERLARAREAESRAPQPPG
eukprot:tig00001093_g6892.t1